MKKAFVELHLAVFLAGFTAVLGRLIDLQEGWLVWYRLLFTFLALSALVLIRKEVRRIPLRDAGIIFLIGFLVAFHWLAFYGSVKYSNASVALVCFGATGFFTALLEPILTRAKFSAGDLFFGLLSLAGIYVIFDFYPGFKTGIIFGVISSLGSAIFPVFNRQILQRYPHRTVIYYEMTGAFLSISMILPFYFQFFPSKLCFPGFYDAFWLLILSLFCTVGAMELSFRALSKISAFTVNLTYGLEPAYGILLAFVFLGEERHFGPSFYAGAGLVLLSIGLHSLRIFRSHKQGKEPAA